MPQHPRLGNPARTMTTPAGLKRTSQSSPAASCSRLSICATPGAQWKAPRHITQCPCIPFLFAPPSSRLQSPANPYLFLALAATPSWRNICAVPPIRSGCLTASSHSRPVPAHDTPPLPRRCGGRPPLRQAAAPTPDAPQQHSQTANTRPCCLTVAVAGGHCRQQLPHGLLDGHQLAGGAARGAQLATKQQRLQVVGVLALLQGGRISTPQLG